MIPAIIQSAASPDALDVIIRNLGYIVAGVIGIGTIMANRAANESRSQSVATAKLLDDVLLQRKLDRQKLDEYEEREKTRQKQLDDLSRDFDAYKKTAADDAQEMGKKLEEVKQEAKKERDLLTGERDTERQLKDDALIVIGQLRQQLAAEQAIVAARDKAIIILDERWLADDQKHEREKRLLRAERDAAQQRVISLEAQIVDLTAQLEAKNTRIQQLEDEKETANAKDAHPTPDPVPAPVPGQPEPAGSGNGSPGEPDTAGGSPADGQPADDGDSAGTDADAGADSSQRTR